jgi:hypothetical protein
MKSMMGLPETTTDKIVSGKDVWKHIKSITPNPNDIPTGFQPKIINRKFKNVDDFNIKSLLNTDPDFLDYFNSNEQRYPEDDVDPNDIYHEIIVMDGELLDGYSRTATLLRKNITTTNAFVAIPQTVNENELLTEKIIEIEDDVNMIYEKYFKHIIDKFNNNEDITYDMLKQITTDTSILQNELCVQAHKIKPCQLIIHSSNVYVPLKNIIGVGISSSAVNVILEFSKPSDAINAVPEKFQQTFKADVSEYRVKGSIHHELTHWIDDVTNNSHIEKLMVSRKENNVKEKNSLKYINTHFLERNAQIHNIRQLYLYHKDVWDQMTFDEMIDLTPIFTFVDKLPNDVKTIWKKDIKLRMNREGLLGKNMR